MLDASRSIRDGDFNKVLVFVDGVARRLGTSRACTRVGVLTFSGASHVAFHLAESRTAAAISEAIMSVAPPTARGQTNTAAALRALREQMFRRERGDRPGVPNVGVLVTDGFSSVGTEPTLAAATEARRRGLLLFGVGVGIDDSDELDWITQDAQRVFLTPDFDSLLSAAMIKALEEVISRSESPSPAAIVCLVQLSVVISPCYHAVFVCLVQLSVVIRPCYHAVFVWLVPR